MYFEKCLNCTPDEWQPIDTDTLQREMSNDQIDMMIWFKAVIRTATAKYRRHIPEVIKDWSKV